jgi:hypothetical protein
VKGRKFAFDFARLRASLSWRSRKSSAASSAPNARHQRRAQNFDDKRLANCASAACRC